MSKILIIEDDVKIGNLEEEVHFSPFSYVSFENLATDISIR